MKKLKSLSPPDKPEFDKKIKDSNYANLLLFQIG